MSTSVSVIIPGLTPPGALKKMQAERQQVERQQAERQQAERQQVERQQAERQQVEVKVAEETLSASPPNQQVELRAKVMVGTPAYGGACFVSYTLSLINSIKFCSQHQIYIEPCFLTNESLIPRGRNTVVAKFLNDPTLTHLLFIDADVSWAPGSIVRLLNHDKDIVGAFYPKKGYEWQNLLKNKDILAMLNKASAENRDLTDQETKQIRAKLMSFVVNLEQGKTEVRNGLLQVKHLGTGFMLIKRQVLEKMTEALPELKYDDDINILTESENKHLYGFFNTEIHKLSAKTHFLSEDYLFCKRWTDMGGEIYGDVNIPLTHTGTHSFAGHFAMAHSFRPLVEQPAKQETSKVEQETSKVEDEPKMTIVKSPVNEAPQPRVIENINQAGSVAPLEKLTPQS